MKKHFMGRFVRYRVRHPSQFKKSSFRTHDIGRKGYSKRIAGRLKKSDKWATQSILITRKDYALGKRVQKVGGKTKKKKR